MVSYPSFSNSITMMWLIFPGGRAARTTVPACDFAAAGSATPRSRAPTVRAATAPTRRTRGVGAYAMRDVLPGLSLCGRGTGVLRPHNSDGRVANDYPRVCTPGDDEPRASDTTKETAMPTSTPMQLGMVGLGRMGAGLVGRLMRDGHNCVVYDVNPAAVTALEKEGATGSTSMAEFVEKLTQPRAVWVMVPAGEITAKTITDLASHCRAATSSLTAGNTYYRDDIRHAKTLSEKGIHHIDCGTSGGVWGIDRGFCLMIGGEDEIVQHLRPIFATIAPGLGTVPANPGAHR